MNLFQKLFFYTVWPRINLLFSIYRRLLIFNELPKLFDKEVLLVGTSPQLDLNLLERHSESFSIGLHRVHKIFHLTSWRPNVLFLGDEALLIQQGKEIISSQNINTVIVLGCGFWIPCGDWKNKFIYLKLRQKSIDDFISTDDYRLQNAKSYIVGDSVLCLAMQYCIKERVKRIVITGVNFNYEQGYMEKSINNIGINQPKPTEAKNQYLYFRRVCSDLGIEVVHDFK